MLLFAVTVDGRTMTTTVDFSVNKVVKTVTNNIYIIIICVPQ